MLLKAIVYNFASKQAASGVGDDDELTTRMPLFPRKALRSGVQVPREAQNVGSDFD